MTAVESLGGVAAEDCEACDPAYSVNLWFSLDNRDATEVCMHLRCWVWFSSPKQG